MNLAIITARGGSKRIPGKNIKEFLGKPIISYSIETALRCSFLDEVMVSTDSKVIADVAQAYGASVPFMRSKINSDDYASTTDVIMEVLDEYTQIGKSYDLVYCIYPTAPLIKDEDLEYAFDILTNNEDVDTVVPVVRFSYPPQRGLVINNGNLCMREPEYKKIRTQDIVSVYHDAGMFYAFRSESFFRLKNLWNGNIHPLILPEIRAQDIDDYDDWLIAELKYRIAFDELIAKRCDL